MDDLISRETVRKGLGDLYNRMRNDSEYVNSPESLFLLATAFTKVDHVIDCTPVVEPKKGEWAETIEWHKIETRPTNEEEQEEFERWYGEQIDYVLDCAMPDDGQEILVLTKYGVNRDVCGVNVVYYLESRNDWDDVIAWAEMPKGPTVEWI